MRCFFSQLLYSLHYLFFSKSIGTVFNFLTSKFSIFVFELFKSVVLLTNLLMSGLATSTFKAIKSFLVDKSNVSTPASFSNYF